MASDFNTHGRQTYYRDLKDPQSTYTKAVLESSNLVGSATVEDPNIHRPILDLDFECRLVPSTTKGHYHLYMDGLDITWPKYKVLLVALADAGVISEAYMRESIKKGFTAARLPWVKKEEDDINSAEPDGIVKLISNEQDWVNNFKLLQPVLEDVYVSEYLTTAERKRYHQAVDKQEWRKVASWLHKAWFSLPDSESIQHMPAFHRFCDLCSETWVFGNEKEKE